MSAKAGSNPRSKGAANKSGVRPNARNNDAIEPLSAVVPLSVRLPRDAHESLRRIAFDRRVSIHSLILEGVEKVLAERGHGLKGGKK